MPRSFLFPNGGGLNFGYLQRTYASSTVLALVALDLDGIDHVGSVSEHANELALSEWWIDGWMRWWESLRTGTQ
jgi:hypothetical protein